MNWHLEEKVEDAFVSYLTEQVVQTLEPCKFYPAWTSEAITYPCAVVHAGDSSPVSDSATWETPTQIAVQIAVITEAAPTLDGSGNVVKSARDRNASVRSEVMKALAVTDLTYHLNDQGISDVKFSMAQVSSRSRSTEDRKFVTTITVDVIASPASDTGE